VDAGNHWCSPVRVFSNPISVQIGDQLQINYWYRPWYGISECEVRKHELFSWRAAGRRILATRNARLAGGRGPVLFPGACSLTCVKNFAKKLAPAELQRIIRGPWASNMRATIYDVGTTNEASDFRQNQCSFRLARCFAIPVAAQTSGVQP
jgi:hypothetical protein